MQYTNPVGPGLNAPNQQKATERLFRFLPSGKMGMAGHPGRFTGI